MLNSDHVVIILVLIERSRRVEEILRKVIFSESSSIVLFMLPHFSIDGVLLLSSFPLPTLLIVVLEIVPNVSLVLTIVVVVLLFLLVCPPLMLHLVSLLLGEVSSLPLLPLMLSLFPLAILIVNLSHDLFEESRDIFETFKKL